MQWDAPCVHASLGSHLPHSNLPLFHTRLLSVKLGSDKNKEQFFQAISPPRLDLILLQSRCREHLQPKASAGLPATSASAGRPKRHDRAPETPPCLSHEHCKQHLCRRVTHLSALSSGPLPADTSRSPPPAGFSAAATRCCGRTL